MKWVLFKHTHTHTHSTDEQRRHWFGHQTRPIHATTATVQLCDETTPMSNSKTGKAITISPPPKLRFGHNSANSARSRRPLHRKMKIINSTVGYECTRMEWIMPRLHQMVDILYEATTVHFTCNWNIYQTEYGCWNNDIDTTRTKKMRNPQTTAKMNRRIATLIPEFS